MIKNSNVILVTQLTIFYLSLMFTSTELVDDPLIYTTYKSKVFVDFFFLEGSYDFTYIHLPLIIILFN